MKYKSVKGMEDILPQDVQIWQELERLARIELESSGYKEIRTPLLEDTAIFVRGIGEASDIVKKEMYTFSDRKERSLTLRPEGTAPFVRAYIEHSLDKIFPYPEGRFYYIGPMFRAERPQKGRSRQFHQIGVEIIGTRDPIDDSEVIIQLARMLERFKLQGLSIKLNSLGCKDDKSNFTKILKDYLKNKKNDLCEDCKNRTENNVLRVLDCKNQNCINIMKDAPSISDNLCDKCRSDFSIVKAVLKEAKINYVETKNLVRGLDYYTGTVFEVTHPALGGQDAIGAGGRYDNLVKELGGSDAGAIGFAVGIERILIALGENIKLLKPQVIYFACLGKEAKIKCIQLAGELRAELNDDPYKLKIVTLIGPWESSLKSQMRNADKNGAKAVIIIGEDELKQGKFIIKDMINKKQDLVERKDILEAAEKILC